MIRPIALDAARLRVVVADVPGSYLLIEQCGSSSVGFVPDRLRGLSASMGQLRAALPATPVIDSSRVPATLAGRTNKSVTYRSEARKMA
jgi:hypothetical protein